jgi:hypothetical protein
LRELFGLSKGIERNGIRRIFNSATLPPGILSPPELPDGFCRLIQPLTIRQQRNQFDGTEKLHRIGVRPAQRPQLPRTDDNGYTASAPREAHDSADRLAQTGNPVMFRRKRRQLNSTFCRLPFVVFQ